MDGEEAIDRIGRLVPCSVLADGAAVRLDGEWDEDGVGELLVRAGFDRLTRTEVELGAEGPRSNGPSALSLHQEDYHLAARPEVLTFLCTESDVDGGETLVAPVSTRALLDLHLDEAEIRFFRQSVEGWTPWRPVVESVGRRIWPRVALPDVHRDVQVRGGAEAFAALSERLIARAEPVRWTAGSVLIVDNRRALHGRRAMTVGRRTLVRWVA